ncbi:MAG: DsbA family protein [Chloroflexi bacterium]|nr:DsbA family protein [Chloroflexota bacterium]
MSEQDEQVLDIVQNAEDGIEQFEEVDDVAPQMRSRVPAWIAPAWFFFGIIVGIVGFAAYTTLSAKPQAAAAPALDAVAMRSAARDGVIEAIATLQAGSGQPSAQQPSEPTVVDPGQFTLRPANTLSSPGAQITIVEFSDFQCPFCGRYQQAVHPQLLKQYVESGQVNFVFKHSAFLGQESVWAAQAAECAADQGKFWEFHDLLFSRQNGENQGAFNKDKLSGFAKEMGLDMAKFEPCLTNDETLARVQADTQEGQSAGVRGTPTFFINGQALVGAQPFEAFQNVLAQQLGQ